MNMCAGMLTFFNVYSQEASNWFVSDTKSVVQILHFGEVRHEQPSVVAPNVQDQRHVRRKGQNEII